MIRALIADDHVVVRKGLKQLFELMGDVTVDGEATNGDEVLVALHNGQFDLILLDLTMPGLSGIHLIERIRLQYTKLPILVLSMHNELQIAKRVLKAGAAGYISKGSEQDTLISAIRKVAAGKRFIDPVFAEQMMFEKPVPNKSSLHERLSERELYILKAFAKGQSINKISEELFISNKTVSTHKARLMQKLNINNNSELIRYAVDHGLVE